MKSTQIKLFAAALGLFLTFILTGPAYAQAPGGWSIPAKFKTLKNPVVSNKESISEGKDLYAKHCKSCHGGAGLGDGTKAATLDVSCSDFSTKKFQALSDGEMFFQVSEGKGKMPSFKKNITEDNARWAIVNYMRTLTAK